MARWQPATTAVEAAASGGGSGYVGWEEVDICTEKGRREIHYTLKRRDGGKDLAVIAKEKSLRHITYRFLLDSHNNTTSLDNTYGNCNNKPRSKRELIDWLNSFLPDTPTPVSPQTSGDFFDLNEAEDVDVAAMKDTQRQKLGSYTKEFLWLGSSSTCKKKRRHYQAFRRNGVKISVNEFVHVLAEEDKRLVAYLDDMYEDVKGNKMVVVRWFHKIDEVGIDLPHNFNDREIFFSLCLQDLNIECIDGLAMVLSSQDYEKFLCVAKHTELEPYLCNRQYDNEDLKPFDITQLEGYGKQEILRYMFSLSSPRPLQKAYLPVDYRNTDVNCDGNGAKPRKRLRLSRDVKMNVPRPTVKDVMDIDDVIGKSKVGSTRGPLVTVARKGLNVEAPLLATAVGSVVEVLSQDSGMRGCWFAATVIKKHKNKVKLRYHDIKDAEDEANCLEEWVMASRIAVREALGIRLHGRTTIRPSLPSHRGKISWAFNVGTVVDVWQHDGWWEGIVLQQQPDEIFRVYFPGEKREAVFARRDLRHSQEWVENTWRELSERPDVAASILSGLALEGTAEKLGDPKSQLVARDFRHPQYKGKENYCSSNLQISSAHKNKGSDVVPDLSKDDFLSQLKWKTLGKRKRCFAVQKLLPRGNIRVHSERTLTHTTTRELLVHSTLKSEKESCKTSKVDRDNCKYISDSVFSPKVVQPPLTSLVMSR